MQHQSRPVPTWLLWNWSKQTAQLSISQARLRSALLGWYRRVFSADSRRRMCCFRSSCGGGAEGQRPALGSPARGRAGRFSPRRPAPTSPAVTGAGPAPSRQCRAAGRSAGSCSTAAAGTSAGQHRWALRDGGEPETPASTPGCAIAAAGRTSTSRPQRPYLHLRAAVPRADDPLPLAIEAPAGEATG